MGNIQKATEIIENSGNNFHSRIVNLLRKEGWEVLISPYYSDNFTDKPREIDIISQKTFDVVDDLGRWHGTVNARLFVECKFINDEMVFWFDDKNINQAIELVVDSTKLNPPKNDPRTNKHHYLSSHSVAKLYASSKLYGADSEPFYKAINQSLNSTIYYRDQNGLFAPKPPRRALALEQISYPVIFTNSFDSLYRVDMGCDTPEKISDPFQLEVNYAYLDKNRNNKNEYFLIDVVGVEKMKEFLESVEVDASMLVENIVLDKLTGGGKW